MSLDYSEWIVVNIPCTVAKEMYTTHQMAIDRHGNRILWRARIEQRCRTLLDVLLKQRQRSKLISLNVYKPAKTDLATSEKSEDQTEGAASDCCFNSGCK